LLQSHDGAVHLLSRLFPGMPWATGKCARDWVARGGFVVDMNWEWRAAG